MLCFMRQAAHILVLGAYGLAGRAIVKQLLHTTPFHVIAAGRDPEKLRATLSPHASTRLTATPFDAADAQCLRAQCGKADFVVNAVGPFSRHGAAIARTVVECGKPYLDCANEQTHYCALRGLDTLAQSQNIPLITAAGATPGFSSLLMAGMLEQFPGISEIDCCWAQFRHAYADAGLASMMGGILEASGKPVVLHEGNPVPLLIGQSTRRFDLPKPFGTQRLLEVPTIDTLTLPARFSLRELHTWFYMGDMPVWLLGLVRRLQPQRRPWAYRVIEAIMRRVNKNDTHKAIAAGTGPESLLLVSARNNETVETQQMLFRDGAVATACLPAHIVNRYLTGEYTTTGLITPLDLIRPEALLDIAGEAVLPIAT